MTTTRRRRLHLPETGTGRIVVLALYYLAVILAGHPKLQHDLRRPAMEEIGARASVFMLEGIKGYQRDYILWLLAQCTDASGEDVITPEAVDALHGCMHSLDMHKRIGPGLLEVPEESNTRGLREVGCLPRAKPGLVPIDGGRGSAEIKDGLASHELGAFLLVNADPVRTHPDSDGWRKALSGSFVVSIASFEGVALPCGL